MRILITGAAGFIGFHSSLAILRNKNEVLGLDNLNDYYDVNLKKDRLRILKSKKKFKFIKGDIEDKKIFAKILHNWDKVKTNFDLMNLHEGLLDNSEKNHIFDIIKEPAPSLQTGAFMHLLNSDKIEGITKNTEGWLQNFRGLTVFK